MIEASAGVVVVGQSCMGQSYTFYGGVSGPWTSLEPQRAPGHDSASTCTSRNCHSDLNEYIYLRTCDTR